MCTADGTTDLRLRTVAKPERMLADLLQHLRPHLPIDTRVIENIVEKTTP